MQAIPNPAIDWVRFDCNNLSADEYTLKIFNIVGKVVWKETFQAAGKRAISLNLENFNKGTYLYSLVNRKGDIIGTKRLVVVKP
ncbi:MAG: T9SS type A sorting domain-containing protein [Lewinellaceae bacterium]|nr:T9SS type A sorting domain-containing protein [Lewinellaceae bacterium]